MFQAGARRCEINLNFCHKINEERGHVVRGKSKGEEVIRRYLLGELPEADQVRLEQQYFSDADFFEQVLIVEDQLIDDYLRGQLRRRERDRFEQHCLASTKRRERVELARALIQTVSKPSTATHESPMPGSSWEFLLAAMRSLSPALRFSIAVTTLLILLGVIWLAVENARLRNGLEQARAQQAAQQQREEELRHLAENAPPNIPPVETIQREQTGGQTQAEPITKQPPHSILSLALLPGLQRGGEGMKQVAITESIRTLQITLNFERGNEYRTYGVAVRTAEGNDIAVRTKLRAKSTASGQIIILSLPSRIFPKGEYVLSLTGETASGSVENIEDYTFSVVRR